MGANVVLAVALFAFIELSRPSLSARYEPGFPSNMLIVKNTGARLVDVRLVIDGRFVHRTRALDPGVHGFEVQRAFEDDLEARPEAHYVPERLRVEHAAGAQEILVAQRRSGS